MPCRFGLRNHQQRTVVRMETATLSTSSGVSTRHLFLHRLSAAAILTLLLASCATKTALPVAPSDTPAPTTSSSSVSSTAAATSSALNTPQTIYSTTVSQERVIHVRPVEQKYAALPSVQTTKQTGADLVTPGDGYTYQLGPAVLEAQLFSDVLVTSSSATEVVLSFKFNSDGLAELLWKSAATECESSRPLCPLQEVAVFSGDVFAYSASLQDLSASLGVLQLGTKLDAVRARSIAQVFS